MCVFCPTMPRPLSHPLSQEHIDAAVGLNPEEPSLHGLLGRFCYEVR